MRCINCYNTIAEDVEFCLSCNFPVYRAKPASERQAEQGTTPNDSPEAHPSSSETPLELAATMAKPAHPRVRPADTARGKRAQSAIKKKKPALPRKPGPNSGAEKYRKVAAGTFTTLAVAGILFYALKSSGFIRSEPDPKASLQAIATVRSLPSTQAGLTVDQAMTKMLDGSRASGDLVGFQGWIVRPVSGDSGKVRVIFSFDEKQGKRQANWLVDLSDNSIAPENDLAAAVYKR